MRMRYRVVLPAVLLAAATMGLAPSTVAAQEGVVTGDVVGATSGQGINGAQVTIDGTTLGGLTNVNGRFLITRVPAGTYTVSVINVGFASQSQEITVTAGGTARADFRLSVSAINLDEIVVTGTAGAVERRKIGVALASVDVSALSEVTPVDGFSQVLEGRIPGVRSIGTVGGVGATRELRIRGTDSFSLGQRPVIYIDGVRVDNSGGEWGSVSGGSATCCAFSGGAGEDRMSDLNPDEIDRIEVLKGPAAATLYGSEASGGVIQIFTKRGRSNSPANFSFSSTLGFNRHRANFPTTLKSTIQGPNGFTAWDPNETLIENGLVNSYDMTVDGGGEEITYFVSGGFSYEEGSVKPNDQKRGNLRVNLNWSASDNLTVGVSSGYVRNRIASLQSGNNWLGIYTNALLGSPFNATVEEPYGGGLDVNVEDAQSISTFSDTDRWTGSVTMQYTPTPNFSHKATLGLDAVNDQKTRILPFGRHYTYIGKGGERNIGYRNARKFTADYLGTLDYDDLFGMFSGAFAFGGQGYSDIVSESMATGKDYAGEGVTTVGGAARTFGGEEFRESVNVGAFVQNRFDFGNLFVTLAVRTDGNSAFGENYGFQVYPKADFAYNLDDGILPEVVSSLKVRAAWGMAGKAPGAFAQFQTYQPNTVLGDIAGVSPRNPGNADLEPENKQEYEIGMDMGLFNNRVGIDATYWNARTTNALLQIALPPSQGFSQSQLKNVGEIKNQGVELSINATVLDRGNIRWNVGTNLEWIKNEVIDLGETAFADSLANYACQADLSCTAADAANPSSWTQYMRLGSFWEGLAISERRARQVIGWDAANQTHIRSTYNIFSGQERPDKMASFFTDVSLGQSLRLAMQLRGEWGATMSNSDRSYGVRQLAYDEYLQFVAADGSSTLASDSVLNYMRLVTPQDSRNHLRLQEVSLAWVIPASISGSIGLNRTTLTLAGYNLYWWDNCNCPDPNQQYSGNDFNASPFLGLPQPRRFLLSFRTRF